MDEVEVSRSRLRLRLSSAARSLAAALSSMGAIHPRGHQGKLLHRRARKSDQRGGAGWWHAGPPLSNFVFSAHALARTCRISSLSLFLAYLHSGP